MAEIARLATAQRIATSWGVPDGVRAGGLFAIGPEQADLYRRTAAYIDKIMKISAACGTPRAYVARA